MPEDVLIVNGQVHGPSSGEPHEDRVELCARCAGERAREGGDPGKSNLGGGRQGHGLLSVREGPEANVPIREVGRGTANR
eukprot:14449538-Alexandrium_andersonii.AAC.1